MLLPCDSRCPVTDRLFSTVLGSVLCRFMRREAGRSTTTDGVKSSRQRALANGITVEWPHGGLRSTSSVSHADDEPWWWPVKERRSNTKSCSVIDRVHGRDVSSVQEMKESRHAAVCCCYFLGLNATAAAAAVQACKLVHQRAMDRWTSRLQLVLPARTCTWARHATHTRCSVDSCTATGTVSLLITPHSVSTTSALLTAELGYCHMNVSPEM